MQTLLTLLMVCQQIQESVLVHTNQVMGRTHDALARAYLQQGDARAALPHARAAVAAVTAAYGHCTLPIAHQSLPLQSALTAVGGFQEMADVVETSQKILRLHIGAAEQHDLSSSS